MKHSLLIPACFIAPLAAAEPPAPPVAPPPPVEAAAGREFTASLDEPLLRDPAAPAPWSPAQATGKPDTPQPGDYSTAWAAAVRDKQKEWLRLEYDTAVQLQAVRIYESYHPGAISRAFVEPATGGKSIDLIPNPGFKGTYTASFLPPAGTAVETRTLTLEIDEPAIAGWNEIDAAGLVDAAGTVHWATAASASSSFGSSLRAEPLQAYRFIKAPWDALQASGPPDTPEAADRPTAWAPATPDGGKEWLEVAFKPPVAASACLIHQSFNPGAITAIRPFDETGAALPEVPAASQSGQASDTTGIAILHARLEGNPVISRLYIELDTAKVSGWNEIDAVGLQPAAGAGTQWAYTASASSSYRSSMPESLSLPPVPQPGSPPSFSTGTAPGSPPDHQSILRLEDLQKRVDNLHADLGSLSGRIDAGRAGLSVQEGLAAAPPLPATVAPSPASLALSDIPRSLSRNPASQKGSPWSPAQATGAPDTPVAGDKPSAWAPKTIAGGAEWLEVSYDQTVTLHQLRIHESNLPGAITSVHAVLPGGGSSLPLTLLTEDNPPDATRPRVLIAISASPLMAQAFRIELDTRKTPTGWPEIDAVELTGHDGTRQWASRATASSSYAERYGVVATPSGFQRAASLDEANQRIDLLNQRLEKLERQLSDLRSGNAKDAPAPLPPGPDAAPPPAPGLPPAPAR